MVSPYYLLLKTVKTKVFTFHYSEPNDKDGEDCVEIGHHDEKWNDRDCSETELSICEMGHEVIW